MDGDDGLASGCGSLYCSPVRTKNQNLGKPPSGSVHHTEEGRVHQYSCGGSSPESAVHDAAAMSPGQSLSYP